MHNIKSYFIGILEREWFKCMCSGKGLPIYTDHDVEANFILEIKETHALVNCESLASNIIYCNWLKNLPLKIKCNYSMVETNYE